MTASLLKLKLPAELIEKIFVNAYLTQQKLRKIMGKSQRNNVRHWLMEYFIGHTGHPLTWKLTKTKIYRPLIHSFASLGRDHFVLSLSAFIAAVTSSMLWKQRKIYDEFFD